MAGFIDTSIGKETDPKSARDRPSAQRLIRWDWRCAVVLGLPTFMRGFEGTNPKRSIVENRSIVHGHCHCIGVDSGCRRGLGRDSAVHSIFLRDPVTDRAKRVGADSIAPNGGAGEVAIEGVIDSIDAAGHFADCNRRTASSAGVEADVIGR